MYPYLIRLRTDDGAAYDITALLQQNGYTCIPFNDIDNDETTGRNTQDGNMQRERITVKHSLSITTEPLSPNDAALLGKLLQPDWLTIEYLDPAQNALCTGVFYRDPGTPSFTTMQVRADGAGYYVVYAPVTIGFQEQ